jgi:hypothetical protein
MAYPGNGDVTAWRFGGVSGGVSPHQDAIQRAERLAAEAASFEMAVGTPRGSNYRRIHGD